MATFRPDCYNSQHYASVHKQKYRRGMYEWMSKFIRLNTITINNINASVGNTMPQASLQRARRRCVQPFLHSAAAAWHTDWLSQQPQKHSLFASALIKSSCLRKHKPARSRNFAAVILTSSPWPWKLNGVATTIFWKCIFAHKTKLLIRTFRSYSLNGNIYEKQAERPRSICNQYTSCVHHKIDSYQVTSISGQYFLRF